MSRARPSCHFTPPAGWMNDPNGLVYFNGEYHLFYQYHPNSLVWGPMHWGHAVSQDLLNWEHLPIALEPDELGTCFSGSAIVDWNNSSGLFDYEAGLIALYTVHKELKGFDQGYIQQQCLAYSHDSGRSWSKFAGNPVLPSNGKSDFRDPKVFWHQPSEHWIQVLAVGQEIHIYRSENLTQWVFCSRFGEGQGAHTEGAWECPDLFELQIDGCDERAWILLVGVGPGDTDFGSFTQYFVGHFDGELFVNSNSPETVLWLDRGRDFYAVQSWSDTTDNSRIVTAWMNNWRYANEVPATTYRGTMALPRSLGLRNTPQGLRVVQTFCLPTFESTPLSQPTSWLTSWLAEGELGARRGRICLKLGSNADLRISFFGLGIDLRLQPKGDRILIEVLRACQTDSPDFDSRFGHQYWVETPSTQTVDLEWVTDLGTLELLFCDGETAITQISAVDCSGSPIRIWAESGEFRVLEYQESLIPQ